MILRIFDYLYSNGYNVEVLLICSNSKEVVAGENDSVGHKGWFGSESVYSNCVPSNFQNLVQISLTPLKLDPYQI